MHYTRAAASIQGGEENLHPLETAAKMTLKNSNLSDMKPPVIMTSDNDVQCFVRKQLISHWLFNDVDSNFICSNEGKWRPHSTAVVNAETIKKDYTVMADGDGDPLISEHFNTICT